MANSIDLHLEQLIGMVAKNNEMLRDVLKGQEEMKERLGKIEKYLNKMDTRLEYLGLKWMEHDEKIQEIRRQV